MGTEAENGVAAFILGKAHGEFMIRCLRILRADPDIHLHTAALNAGQCHPLTDGHLGVFCLPAPIQRKLTHRLLIQAAVTDGQFSGQAHLPKPQPVFIPCILAGIPVLHPSDHDPPPVRGQQGLRGIEIDAVVNGLIRLRKKAPLLLVKRADLTDRPVAVMVFKAFRQHILRTDKQHMLSFEREKVRAFPHQAEASVILRQNTPERPVKPVLTAVQQKHTPLVLPAGTDHAAIAAVFCPPDFRVAEIIRAQALRQVTGIQDRIMLILLVIQSVPHGNALRLEFLSLVAAFLADPCIQQHLPAVRKFHRTA